MFHAMAAAFGRRPVRGVEIGVQYGINAEIELFEWPHEGRLHLTLVEIDKSLESVIRDRLEKRLIDKNRYDLIMEDSQVAGPKFEKESLDFVYIDDDHSFEGCMRSIESWKHAVKMGGFIGGHDYHNMPEVRKAAESLLVSTAWPMYVAEWDWWFVKS
jgi:predicted O-methyltransferase YrrM